MTLREAILQANDWDIEPMDVGGAWGTIYLRSLSAKEKLDLAERFEGEELKSRDAAEFFCNIVVLCVCEESKAQVFTTDDVPALMSKNWNTVERIAKQALKFNGMDSESSVEETAKN